MATNGDPEHTEVLVIEGSQAIAQQVMAMLATSGTFRPRILPPDRELMPAPGWVGPEVLLVGLDADRAQRLASARRVQSVYPGAIIIGYTSNYVADVLAEATYWGARRILRSPFDLAALEDAVRDVDLELRGTVGQSQWMMPPGAGAKPAAYPDLGVASTPNRVIAVFSPKGGVGCSTLAVNLAVALQVLGHPTSLVDGNISFGSLDVFLNLRHTRSILQLVGDVQLVTGDAVLEALVEHGTGLQVLLAPPRPEEGDSIRGEHLQRVLAVLSEHFRFTLVDTWPSFDERVLAVLEVADEILVPIGPELPAMKNMKQFLRVATLLNYDMDKITPVLMRANSVPPGHLKDIERFLDRPLRWRVVSDGKRTTAAANTGIPFVLNARDSAIGQNILDIARHLIEQSDLAPRAAKNGKTKPDQQQVGGGRFWRR